jgi:hypothetical protein
MVLIGMALLSVTLVTTVDAAPKTTTESADDRVAMQETDCKFFGGTASTHFELDTDFNIISAQVSCVGGDLDGRFCDNTETTVECDWVGSFVQPTQQVVPEQRPDTAAPVENPQQTRPVVDDIAAPPGGVAEDPTGDEDATGEEQARIAEQEAAEQTAACENAGGAVNEKRSAGTIEVRCKGGVLDGMVCRNGHYTTDCGRYYRGQTGPEDPNAIPTGEIEFVQVESEAELEAALRGLAEDPTGANTVVIVNEVASNISEDATNQVLACEALGGTATVHEERTVASGLKWVDVVCKGGLLDGLRCVNTTGIGTACWIYRSVLPEDPRVTPVAGVEVPAGDVPTATVVATEGSVPPTATSPVPTVAPTAVAAEPTVAPPSDPPPPRNDNSVPPGDSVEPGKPTPTPVVLL